MVHTPAGPRRWAGWVSVTVASQAAVVQQVHEFVEQSRQLFQALQAEEEGVRRRLEQSGKDRSRRSLVRSPPPEHPTEVRRKHAAKRRAVLRSATLRADVLEDFADAHPHAMTSLRPGQRSFRSAIDLLRAFVEESKQCVEPTWARSASSPSASAVGRSAASLMPQLSVTPADCPPSPSGNRQSVAFDREPSFSPVEDGEVGSPTGDTRPTRDGQGDANGVALQLQQLRTKEEALGRQLRFSLEREQRMLTSLWQKEEENLRLERQLVCVDESRRRMKGVIEEQTYATALLTRVAGLLHLEWSRSSESSVARGVIFWGLSLLLSLHTLLTGGQAVVGLYGDFRAALSVLPSQVLFLVDSVCVAIAVALVHNWACYALHDRAHGAMKCFADCAADCDLFQPPPAAPRRKRQEGGKKEQQSTQQQRIPSASAPRRTQTRSTELSASNASEAVPLVEPWGALTPTVTEPAPPGLRPSVLSPASDADSESTVREPILSPAPEEPGQPERPEEAAGTEAGQGLELGNVSMFDLSILSKGNVASPPQPAETEGGLTARFVPAGDEGLPPVVRALRGMDR